ncbi:hypothetical protein TNCV_608911 [Trichonephila clavipes]|nr:hypothetical protein TNCV_608911 [Trichonephila clavipes]
MSSPGTVDSAAVNLAKLPVGVVGKFEKWSASFHMTDGMLIIKYEANEHRFELKRIHESLERAARPPNQFAVIFSMGI